MALNDRHSVDDRRKFARAAVPVGARFSVELSGWGCDDFRGDLEKIVALFRHPRLRLGAGSGRGYGRIKLLAAWYEGAAFDCMSRLRDRREEPPSVPLSKDLLADCKLPHLSDTVLTLELQCTDLMRIGASGPHARNLTHLAQRARNASTGKIVESPVGQPEKHDGGASSKSSRENVREQKREGGADKGGDAILKLLREPRIVWERDEGQVIAVDKEEATLPEEQFVSRFPVRPFEGPWRIGCCFTPTGWQTATLTWMNISRLAKIARTR